MRIPGVDADYRDDRNYSSRIEVIREEVRSVLRTHLPRRMSPELRVDVADVMTVYIARILYLVSKGQDAPVGWSDVRAAYAIAFDTPAPNHDTLADDADPIGPDAKRRRGNR